MMESFSFGDNPTMANELLGLVLEGRKTATAWAAVHGPRGAKVGQRMVVKDGQGRPRVVIETTQLTRLRFDEVDASFARDEGEGDGSLDYWREAHTAYFRREGTFSENMEVYAERFRVVDILAL